MGSHVKVGDGGEMLGEEGGGLPLRRRAGGGVGSASHPPPPPPSPGRPPQLSLRKEGQIMERREVEGQTVLYFYFRPMDSLKLCHWVC